MVHSGNFDIPASCPRGVGRCDEFDKGSAAKRPSRIATEVRRSLPPALPPARVARGPSDARMRIAKLHSARQFTVTEPRIDRSDIIGDEMMS